MAEKQSILNLGLQMLFEAIVLRSISSVESVLPRLMASYVSLIYRYEYAINDMKALG